jgi:hypothetical protein
MDAQMFQLLSFILFDSLEEEVRVPLWKASDESSSSMIKIMYNCVFCTAWREKGGEEGQMIDG